MIKTLLIILALSSSPSDDSLVFQSPQQIFEKASALESDENYEAALELYHLISESDTSYIKAQFKKMALYNATGHYDKTIEIGLSLKDKYTPLRENIYIELGNAYSKEEKYHRALEIYQEGSALFPYSHVLLYNIGLAYRNLEDYKTALSYFKKSARINPYYMNNHVMLGYISMLQGHRSKAMMSYLMSLAISPDNNGILVFLESLSSDAIRIEGSIEKFESNELFQYYDDIIRSRAAQDPRFVQEVDFNANIIKNTELLLQKLEYRDNTDDFWMNYYVPFYFNLAKQNLEPHFLYYTLYSTNNDEVKKFINKNSDEKDAWISLANEYLSSNRSTQHATVMGQKDEYSFWYYNSNALSAIGNQIDDETRTGPWMFFYESGQLNAIGKYDDSGNKTGLWKYYHENGRLSRTEKYQENAIVEPARYYHENGALSIIAHYDGEILDGSLEHYYACGALKEIIPLKQGVKSGSGQYFFNTGQKMTDYLIQNDTLSGLYKKFFKNGQTDVIYTLKNGDRHGEFLSYYVNGALYEKGQYENGLETGDWTGYYDDDTTKRFAGSFENGKRKGTWTFYHKNGNLDNVLHYNENGELHGSDEIYNEHGVLTGEFTYHEGKLIGVKQFDAEGIEIFSDFDDSGNLSYQIFYNSGKINFKGNLKNGQLEGETTSYHTNGMINRKGNMVEGKYHGPHEVYDAYGNLIEKVNYKNGSLHGYYYSYYKNGKVKNEGWYFNDQQEQLWKRYFPDGTLAETNYYINGNLNGWSHNYGPHAKHHRSYKYDMGMLVQYQQYDTLGKVINNVDLEHGNGLYYDLSVNSDTLMRVEMQCGEYMSNFTKYYPGGQINYIYPSKNGWYQGIYKGFHPNGKKILEGSFVNNERNGQWQWFFENGNKEIDNHYHNGRREKSSKGFYYNGQLESECNFQNGEKHGYCYYYAPSGELQIIKKYDELLGFTAYIVNQDTLTFDTETKEIKTTFKNGKTAIFQKYKNGRFEGESLYYNSDGTLVDRIPYHQGDYHGERLSYYPNGNLLSSATYQFDMKHGIEKEYHENGNIKRSTNYFFNIKNGWERHYDRNGNVTFELFYWNDELY